MPLTSHSPSSIAYPQSISVVYSEHLFLATTHLVLSAFTEQVLNLFWHWAKVKLAFDTVVQSVIGAS